MTFGWTWSIQDVRLARGLGAVPARPRRVGLTPPSVVHRLDPELGQLGHALAHVLDHLRCRTLPARDLLDDPQRLGRSVGAGRVPGEALVGDVRVVFDRAEGLDAEDPSGPLAASELGSQGRALARGGQVDVFGLTP